MFLFILFRSCFDFLDLKDQICRSVIYIIVKSNAYMFSVYVSWDFKDMQRDGKDCGRQK